MYMYCVHSALEDFLHFDTGKSAHRSALYSYTSGHCTIYSQHACMNRSKVNYNCYWKFIAEYYMYGVMCNFYTSHFLQGIYYTRTSSLVNQILEKRSSSRGSWINTVIYTARRRLSNPPSVVIADNARYRRAHAYYIYTTRRWSYRAVVSASLVH